MVDKPNISQISKQISITDHPNKNQRELLKSHKKTDKKTLFKYMKLLFTVIFHYSDFVTDILLVLYIYQLMQEERSQGDQNLVNILLVLVFGITYNRFQLYNLCLQIQYYLKKLDVKFRKKTQESGVFSINKNSIKKSKNNNTINNITNSNKINNSLNNSNILNSNNLQHSKAIEFNNSERFKIALQVLFFVEQINFFLLERNLIKHNRKKSKTSHFLLEKEVSDLYIENYFSFTIGLCIMWLYTYDNESPGWIAVSSTVISLISVTSIQTKLYKKRIENSYKYNILNFQNFEQFPPDLQLYLAYPGQIHLFKFHVNIKGIEYKHLFKNDQYKKENVRKPKLSILKQILVFFYVFIYCVSATLVSTIQNIAQNMMKITVTLIIGWIVSIPYQYKYWKLYKKYKGSVSCKVILKEILKQPLYMIIGTVQYLFPMMTHEIPFIPETKQTWIYNYAPSFIQILLIQITQIYQLYVTLDVVYTKENSEIYFIDTEEKLDNITNPDKIFRKFIYVTVVFFILNFICTILYFSDKLYQKYFKKAEKKPSHEQNVQKIDEESNKMSEQHQEIVKIDLNQQKQQQQQQQQQQELEQTIGKVELINQSTEQSVFPDTPLEGQFTRIKTDYQLNIKDSVYVKNSQSYLFDGNSTNRQLNDKNPVKQQNCFSFCANDSFNWESQIVTQGMQNERNLKEINTDFKDKNYSELNLTKFVSERQNINKQTQQQYH